MIWNTPVPRESRYFRVGAFREAKSDSLLGLIGAALNECTDRAADAEAVSPLRSDAMAHENILLSYVALACLGKSAFEAITGFREDEYFATALGLDQVPSEGILRQRMDANAAGYQQIVEKAAIE